jgi:hypothetical protein
VVSNTPRPLYPRERPCTHCTEGWVGPRASLDVCEKSRPHRDSIPGPSSPWSVAIPTELSNPLALVRSHHILHVSRLKVKEAFLSLTCLICLSVICLGGSTRNESSIFFGKRLVDRISQQSATERKMSIL